MSGYGQNYNQITNIGDLTDGYYVIAVGDEDYAMNNTHNGTYLDRTSISPVASVITNPPAAIIWKIETNGSGRTIYSEDSSKYISYTGGSNNVQIVNAVTANNQRWNITYSGGNFIFSNLALTSRDLQYNSGSPRFACYTGSQRDLALYKLDEPSGPTITYNGNDNTGGTPPSDGNAYESGDTVTVLGNTGSLTKTCSSFNNWNTAADGSGTPYSANNTFSISANTTLYAQWLTSGNTVTFDSNGGTGTMSPQTNCVAENLTANTFTNAGFTFNSWNTAIDDSGTTYADNASYSFAADVTLYAQWDVFVGPCHTEDFSTIGSSSGYDTRTWTGEGGTWTATGGREDRTINGKAITIRNGTLTSPSFSDGIGDITMTTNLPFSGSNGNLIVKINGSTVGTIPYSSFIQTTTISNINIGGTIIITVENNNSTRVSIDDLNWTCYAATPCSGTPSPGNTITSETSVVTGGTTNLSLQNTTAGSGVTYQWQSSTTSAVAGFTNIAGATSSTYTATVNEKTWYHCVVTCSGNDGTSTVVMVDAVIAYCDLEATNTGFEHISNVTVGTDIDHDSGSNGYEDNTSEVANVTIGTGTSLSVTDSSSYSSDNVYAYVDWNQDGDWDDTDETISMSYSAASGSFTATGTITAPGTAVLGNTIMRVIIIDGSVSDACNGGSNFTYGEVEDYTITIIPSCTPATDPSGTITGTSPACTSTVLTYGGADSANAYWQTIEEGTSISEPATATKTVTTSGTYYVRIYDGTCWSTLSADKTVIINATTAIATPPADTYAVVGNTATFNITAIGAGFSYQWQQKIGAGAWTNVGTNSASFITPNTTLAMDGYQYRVLVAGTCGNATSSAAVLTVGTVPLCDAPLLEENFVYGACEVDDFSTSAEAMSNWTFVSDGDDPLKYNSTSLSYSGYPSSGIGGSAEYQGGGDDDFKREISNTGVSSGEVYTSFLLNITGAGSLDYFFSFMDDHSTPQFYGRVNMRSSGAGYQLGITKYTNSVVWNTPVLTFNNTYLVIVKNEFIAGGANDVLKMWIISGAVPITEAAAGTPISATTNDTDPVSSIKYITIKQTGKENGLIDGIRVATSWESLFCGTIPTATSYTWTGASSTSWANASNWSPNGIPTGVDNIIINSPGTHTLNIADCRSVNNFTLNGTGNFNMASTGVFSVEGDVTYGGTATATLDCDSQMFIKSPNSQPIPPLTYGSLDVLGGDRVFSPTGTIKICGGFNVVPDPSTSIYTVTGSTVEYTSPDLGWVMTPFTYNNLTFSGTGDFSLGYSSPAVNKTVNVLGDFVQTNGTVFLGETSSRTATLNIDGNMTVSGGTFDVNNTSGGIGIVNLKGDLSIASSAQLFATNASTATFNFNGIGDGLSAATTQTIDIASTNTSNVDFNVKTNAYTQLINQNFRPAARTKLNVETGATLDFGFNGSTALNLAGNGITGTGFTSATGSYLKISSPQGIMSTSGAVGNIQTNTAPVINTLATFHYIGKTNQVTGNGFGTSSNGRAVIVELADNSFELGLSQSFGITGLTNTNINNGLGGILNIKKGKVIEDATNYITGSTGSLTMEDGTLYAIAKNSANDTDYIPRLNNTTIPYDLNGTSTIQLNGTGHQILRGQRDYRNLTFSTSGIKDISDSILNITGTILIEDDAVLNIEYEESMGGSGTNLTMTGNSEYITASTTSGGIEPAAQGTYTLIDNSKITFAHNIANGITLQTPKLPKIYNNIDIVGDHVGIASLSAAAPIKFNGTYNPTFTVKPTGVFKFNNSAGFNGGTSTAIDNTNSPTITLETGSTVEYAGDNQFLTEFLPSYSNLNISGTGRKEMGLTNIGIIIGEDLNVIASELYIDNSKFVQVEDNAVIAGAIKVETKGAFVQVDDAGTFSLSGSGTATVNKVSSDKTTPMDYTYWSSPIETITIESVLTGTPASRKYKYVAANYRDEYMENGNNNDETTLGQDDIDDDGNDWDFATGIMTPGSGYAMTGPSILPPGPATYVDEIDFTGTFNTADIPTKIYENGFAADNDWNLIGNPYPSAIDFSLFHAENSAIIDGCAFVWSHSSAPDLGNNGNEVYNFSQDDYSIITVGSGCVVAGPTLPILTNTSIPSGQGFFVIGKHITGSGTSANAVFKNAMRIADGTSNNEFYRNAEPTIEANKIWVNLTSDNGIFNQALIAYVDGATDNFDSYSYDAPRNLSSGTAAIIYTKIEDSPNKNFAIQGKNPNSLTLDEVIPLGFYTTIDVATLYKFSIAQLEGEFMNTNAIYILDKLNNTTHNLKDSDYTFTSETGEFNDRFEIVFTQSTLSINDNIVEANEVTITEFQNGDVQIKVGNTHTIKHVVIMDVTGRIVYRLQGNDSTEIYDLSKLSQAAYIAKITLSNGQVISKKAIKQH
ncbi:hypothetical protein ADIWIN_3310 [Winogradskyella psychrotolerans RS-3]|uniref:GEVED domain-containing protein n=1 Tax=Winogradskyella psychrotolerans RS-3 TaxID=641526 RepID=S7X4H5_9FLAO|nr:hypothetical protein ADIWIN_3310 [Winogradskyella psychrotolerans RS-3]